MSWGVRTLALAAALWFVGCGPTIGDPCTVEKDCGSGTCLNRDFTPGGACSLACEVGRATCPAGTTCVKGALSRVAAGCMRTCTTPRDCRSGYVCKRENDSSEFICVGPQGI
jgi:hypothetical protein